MRSTGLVSSLFVNKSKLMFTERSKSHKRSSKYFFVEQGTSKCGRTFSLRTDE